MQTEQPTRKRPPFRERLLPLLYRRISFGCYRRSERYARYRARAGAGATPPLPPIAETLAVYLSQRLPAWLVSRLGVAGLLRLAKVLAIVLALVAFSTRPAFRLLRAIWRGMRGVRTVVAARSQSREEVVGASRGST